MKFRFLLPLLAFFCWAATLQTALCENRLMVIDDFESGLDARWKSRSFKGETDYSVIEADGGRCLKAESHASASGLIYEIDYDLRDYPVLSWRWKVENVLQKGDERSREGDDYAARIYVVFPHFVPTLTRSINYIWANKLAKGNRLSNAYYRRAVMIAVQSGDEHVGQWLTEARDVYEDYRTCFGENPPEAGAIAIMTDTDNTGESAVAYYDDLRLEGQVPVFRKMK